MFAVEYNEQVSHGRIKQVPSARIRQVSRRIRTCQMIADDAFFKLITLMEG